MNTRHLPRNFADNLEALFRKTRAKLKKRSSTPQYKTSSNQEDHRSFTRNLCSEFEVMANKSIRELSAPNMDNIRTGPGAEIDGNFELKPGLINMVQSNQFCGKTHEDASAHLQRFLEICSTLTISGVPRDAILLRLFPFSLLRRAKQWFYATKEKNTMWALCSTNFLAKFFPMGMTNALLGKITSFQREHDKSVPEAWERFQDYILECPHHGMESSYDKSWMLQLEEHSYHLPYHKPYINNNNYYYNHPQQNQGWNQQRPNYSGNYQGNNFYNNNNNFPPLKELLSNQGKLMDNLSKKLASNDKMLENINNRMDNFSTAMKNQISFNKKIESHLNQIAAVVPATNPGILSQLEGLESANLVDMFDTGNY